jgi:hypothetical protein
MPSYLPIRANSRSQAVRIGGKTIKTNVTAYIDLGYLDVPATPTKAAVEVGKKAEFKEGGEGLKKEVYFAYYVTAVDASGNETTPTLVVSALAGKGAEVESEYNFVEVKFVAVDRATKYNIYRAGVAATGYATAALAEAAAPKLIATVTPTTTGAQSYLDTGVALKTQILPTVNNTFYNTGGTSWSTRHELANHQAIGAITVVGNLTPNPNDWAPWSAAVTQTPEAEKVKFQGAEVEWIQRSTGTLRKVAEAKVAKGANTGKPAAGKEVIAVYYYNPRTNLIESVVSAEVAEKTAGLQAKTEGEVPAGAVQLTVYKTLTASTTPVLVSGLDTLARVLL